jgi:predicted PurR-regulated permease PerM
LSQTLRLALVAAVPLILFLLTLLLLGDILLPFLVGLAAAYMLDPVADRLERMRFSRTAATALIAVGLFLVLAITLLLLLPPLAGQAAELAAELPGYLDGLRDRAMPYLSGLLKRANISGGDVSPEGLIKDYAGSGISVLMKSATGLLQSGAALLNVVALLFITPIVAFYLLRDWDRMIANLRDLVPPPRRSTVDRLGREIDEVLAGFIRGQGLVCLFLALFYGLGLWIAGLQYGLIIGLFTGFFSFIPFIGMAIGLVVGMSVAVFQFQEIWMILVIAGLFGLGQFIEGNLISPRLVGSRIHLHPVWMIFAVLAGTALFGLLGTLIAVPFAGVIGVLIRFAIERYQESEVYHDREGGEDGEGGGPQARARTPTPAAVASERKTGTEG